MFVIEQVLNKCEFSRKTQYIEFNNLNLNNRLIFFFLTANIIKD